MAVKYKIEFESDALVKYRVDIYDPTYSGAVIPLQGGGVPFQKDDDADENFFKGIRTSTAKLSIVLGENNTLMEELFPTNSISRPIELIRLPGGEVEWQGFLSCEAYTQEYVDRVRELVIPCNSVLAAMENHNINDTTIHGSMKIKDIINTIFDEVLGDSGLYWQFCTPERDEAIYDKYIQTTMLFELKENINGYETIYSIEGISCKDALERIATFMGWCIREVETTFYFCRQGDNSPMWLHPEVGSSQRMAVTLETKDIDTFDWMGYGHQISIDAGAKSVEVVANVGKIDQEIMEMPNCPPINLYEGEKRSVDVGSSGFSYEKLYGNHNMELTNLITRKQMSVAVVDSMIRTWLDIVDEQGVFNECVLKLGTYISSATYTKKVGAFFAKMKMYVGTTPDPVSERSGLYISGLPYGYNNGMPGDYNHVYSQRSLKKYQFNEGYLKIDLKALQITGTGAVLNPIVSGIGQKTMNFIVDGDCGIYISIRFGDKYFQSSGYKWGDTFDAILLTYNESGKPKDYFKLMTNENDCFYIPINEELEGDIEVRLYPFINGHGYTVAGNEVRLVDAIVTKLAVSYESTKEGADNSQNKYYRLLNAGFSNEVSIQTELATDMNNHSSEHILKNDDEDKTVMTELVYTDGTRRPEIDLLNRMATHYGSAKRKITLQVEHPTEPLPLMRVIDTDDRVYIPVAESRDYAADTSEITLLEV